MPGACHDLDEARLGAGTSPHLQKRIGSADRTGSSAPYDYRDSE